MHCADQMIYEVVDKGCGFVIVSRENMASGVEVVERTKPQLDKQFLDKLAAGLNKEPASNSYLVSLNVLSKYEYAI